MREANPSHPDSSRQCDLRALHGQEKQDQSCDTPTPTPSQLGDVEYRYLTFSTELPPPSFARSAPDDAAQTPPPEPPDLRPYISPFLWSEGRKTLLTIIACLGTVLSAAAAGSYSPPQALLSVEWGVSRVVYNIGLTIYCIGFAIAPMALAPFSEINGRRPMFLASGLLFNGSSRPDTILCDQRFYLELDLHADMFLRDSLSDRIRCDKLVCGDDACAVLLGCWRMYVSSKFCSIDCLTDDITATFSTMVGGVISDIYEAEDRNAPMALFSGAAMFGTGLGPLFSGFIVQNTSWRWVFYSQAIAAAALLATVTVFFKETRGSVLLSRKAKALNKYYEALEEAGYAGLDVTGPNGEKIYGQRVRWKVKSDEERETLAKMVGISLYRPFRKYINSATFQL